MIALIRRHPLASYFALAFALSWGGVYAIVAPGAIPAPPRDAQRLFVFVYLAMLVGPPVAGIAMTGAASGLYGLSAFRRRLLRWRVAPLWYAVAVFTAPLALVITLLVLSQTSSDFSVAFLTGESHDAPVPIPAASQASFVVMALLVGLGAGFFEELGWTGFAIPVMRRRHGLVATGVIVGLLWGAWHWLAILWGSANALGSVPIPLYMLVALFSFLPPYRVLMAWVYDRTQSILVAIVMHASLTTSMLILSPPVAGWAAVTNDLVFAAVLWVIVGLVRLETREPATAMSHS